MQGAAKYHEEWIGRTIGWTPIGKKPKPEVLGVRVDEVQMWSAFRKNDAKAASASVQVPPRPPRVRMVAPPTGKVPANAQRLIQRLSEAGFEVHVTYGVSGKDRFDPDRGLCGVCDKIISIVAEGALRAHLPKERVQCPGSGSIPEEAKKNEGKCLGCHKKKTLDKDGTIKRHDIACTGIEPVSVTKGKPLPPSESLAIRVKKFGAACWIDGAYEMGGVIEGKRIVLLGWDEFSAKVSEACERARGSEYVLPLGAESGKSETDDAQNAT